MYRSQNAPRGSIFQSFMRNTNDSIIRICCSSLWIALFLLPQHFLWRQVRHSSWVYMYACRRRTVRRRESHRAYYDNIVPFKKNILQ